MNHLFLNISRFLAVVIASVVAISASAETITVGSGQTVASQLADNDITSLTVNGTITAADLQYIAALPALRTLDLTGAEIVAYRTGDAFYAANTIPAATFAGSKLTAITFPQAPTVIADAAFAGSALESVVIPANVASIGIGAFACCPNMLIATLNDVTVLGANAFADCQALAAVDLNGATVIPDNAFAGCTALATVAGLDNVVTIGKSAFKGDSALESVTFSPDLKTIGADAFAKTALKNISLAGCSALTTIGDHAFAENTELTSVALPSNLKNLGTSAFIGCTALSTITMPTGTDEIPAYAFTGTPVAASDILHDGIAEIGDYAMKGNTSSEVVLPANLAHIGDGAMEGMTNLEKIDGTKVDEVPTLGNDVWAGIDKSKVKLLSSDELADAYKGAAQWQDFDISYPGQSGIITGITATDKTSQHMQARFVGKELQIRSIDGKIAEIAIYDSAGRQLLAQKVDADALSIDTSSWSERIYIVRGLLADGATATAKLVR